MKLTKTYIQEFVEMITMGHEMIHKACVSMVEHIDADPSCKQDYRDAMPNLPGKTWGTFEKIGRDTMDWRLALGGVKNDTFLKRLPMSDQKRFLDGDKAELLLSSGDTLMVDPLTCNLEQAKQLFDGDMVRGLSEQRAHMEAEERAWEMVEKIEEMQGTWRVYGSRARVRCACDLSKGDLLAMLSQIK